METTKPNSHTTSNDLSRFAIVASVIVTTGIITVALSAFRIVNPDLIRTQSFGVPTQQHNDSGADLEWKKQELAHLIWVNFCFSYSNHYSVALGASGNPCVQHAMNLLSDGTIESMSVSALLYWVGACGGAFGECMIGGMAMSLAPCENEPTGMARALHDECSSVVGFNYCVPTLLPASDPRCLVSADDPRWQSEMQPKIEAFCRDACPNITACFYNDPDGPPLGNIWSLCDWMRRNPDAPMPGGERIMSFTKEGVASLYNSPQYGFAIPDPTPTPISGGQLSPTTTPSEFPVPTLSPTPPAGSVVSPSEPAPPPSPPSEEEEAALCGNGAVDVGEECDDPDPARCTSDCRLPPNPSSFQWSDFGDDPVSPPEEPEIFPPPEEPSGPNNPGPPTYLWTTDGTQKSGVGDPFTVLMVDPQW